MVPKSMVGENLISLNEMKLSEPTLYENYAKKYFDHPDRPKLLAKSVPKLNCLWNDVIFLLPLHPYYIYEALNSIGSSVKKDLMFYKIPTERLLENKNAVFLYSKEKDNGPASEIPEDEVELIDIISYEECSSLPVDTYEYFKEGHKNGSQMGMFVYIPHILSLGSINVKDVERVIGVFHRKNELKMYWEILGSFK
ncbi:group-specific protein [Ureibacillus chungkukjangi]|nr:group-specific protein [Ureibacillus chungkukjangi]